MAIDDPLQLARAGTRIPALRRAAGLSQRALADKLDTLGLISYRKHPRIVNLEHGRKLLTNEQAALFAEALGCTVDDLMAGTEDAELAQLRAELADIVAKGREQRRQLRTLESKLRERGALTKAERKRFDELSAAVSWARSQVQLYRSRMDYLQSGGL
jgi:transcriptional regulator with XRE-family HTH domain